MTLYAQAFDILEGGGGKRMLANAAYSGAPMRCATCR